MVDEVAGADFNCVGNFKAGLLMVPNMMDTSGALLRLVPLSNSGPCWWATSAALESEAAMGMQHLHLSCS